MMVGELIKLADYLDSRGMIKEGDDVDKIIKEAFLGWICLAIGCMSIEVANGLLVKYSSVEDQDGNIIDISAECPDPDQVEDFDKGVQTIPDNECVAKTYLKRDGTEVELDSTGNLPSGHIIECDDKIIIEWFCSKYKETIQDVTLTWRATREIRVPEEPCYFSKDPNEEPVVADAMECNHPNWYYDYE